MELLSNYYAWTYRRLLPFVTGEVVELGCGAGLGIATYLDQVDHVYAVDYNADLLMRLERSLADDRVTAIQADLRGKWIGLEHILADTIILMDALEHFEDDAGFVAKATAMLKPGGHIALKVPAHASLFSPMDEASGHFRRYDKDDILLLARQLGLEVVLVEELNRIGAAAYRLKRGKATNFSRSFTPWQLYVINACIPLLRIVDNFPYLPGLSLLAVLRSPSL